MEAFSSNLRHFEQFWGFLKTFSEKVWGFYKKYETFWRHFQDMEASIRNLRLFQRLAGFLKTFSMELRLFSKYSRLFEIISR
jgi:hypothetical protein